MRAIDLFCGAGGSSAGARALGIEIVAGFDLWETARSTFADNFPAAKTYGGRIENVRLGKIKKKIGKIDLILASPECTNHTIAKGAAPRCEISRATAFQVVRFAKAFRPRWIVVENVVEMRRWDRYATWVSRLRTIGYNIREEVINSAEFGVPQSRRRLFILCDLQEEPGKLLRPDTRPLSVNTVLQPNNYRFSPLNKAGRAAATLERARTAIQEVGRKKPFLLVYYGSDRAGGWQPLDRPLRTITTLDRFAYVRPINDGHEMRMLQVPELKRAMGFPAEHKLNFGSRRDKIKLLGNAVCPPVLTAILRSLVRNNGLKLPVAE